MKQSIKAALISGLVFPGLGQILVLKRIARGCIFLLPSLAGALYILSVVFSQINRLAGQLANGTLPFDVPTIVAQIAASRTDGPGMTAATLACVLCWSASIIDAILFGNDEHLSPHYHHHPHAAPQQGRS
jgi:TM2 domain-containing membrane protein YozV